MKIQTIKIILPPIGLDTQIQDAIEGENEETKLAVQDKKEKVKINLNRIVSINNSPVRECWIKEGNLHYYMANGKDVEYYFPIKYVRTNDNLFVTRNSQMT